MRTKSKVKMNVTQQAINAKAINSNKVAWKYPILALGAIALLVIVFTSFFIVPAGYKGVLFNSFTGINPQTYGEGFHFKLSVFEHPTQFEVRTRVYNADASAASQDLQIVTTKVALNYHVTKDKVYTLFRDIGADYEERIISPSIQETVKAVTAKHIAEDLIKDRERIKVEIKDSLRTRLASSYIVLDDLSITNFDFSEEFNKAIESKVTAEQNALKEQNNLKVIEFQAQQKVSMAKGESEAIKIINEELQRSPQYVSYLTIQKWDGKMPLALGSGSLLSITGNTASSEAK